jgi:hypothetical protein
LLLDASHSSINRSEKDFGCGLSAILSSMTSTKHPNRKNFETKNTLASFLDIEKPCTIPITSRFQTKQNLDVIGIVHDFLISQKLVRGSLVSAFLGAK